MTGRVICLAAAIVALSARDLVRVDAQQNPPRDTRKPPAAAPAAPTGTAVISGVVTNEDGSNPVRFAYMLLLGAGTGIVKVSSTDADGKFTFAGLPADRYTVAASKPPYLGAIAGAKRPARPGTPIAVADGQKISNVTIRMPMGGSVSGVVTDEKGETGGIIVVTLQQWRMQGGERSLVTVPGGTVRADDRGRYRFFGLPPGEYVVTAMKWMTPPILARPLSTSDVDAALRGGAPAAPVAPAASPVVRYAPTFYPGTTRASDTTTILLGAAEERVGVDFRVEMVPTSRLEGTVTGSDGQPLGNVTVLITSAAMQQTTAAVRVGPDGRFAISGMVPGSYALTAMGSGGPVAGQFAQSIVDVAGADVAGVQLVMRPGMTISGQLVFEGSGPAPSAAGRFVPMRPPGVVAGAMARTAAPQSSVTNETGAFTISNVAPGRYFFGGPLSFGHTKETMTWSLKSVVADGRDVTDLPLDVEAGNAPKQVVVTYSDRFQELSGRLQSQSGAAATDYTIIAFPEDRAYWISGTRRIAVAHPGTDGRFTLSGPGPMTLPPGRYLIAAVTDIGPDEQFDPAFLAQLVPASVPVALGAGEKKVQDLAIR